MARRRRKKARQAVPNANVLNPSLTVRLFRTIPTTPRLSLVEDRRTYHPLNVMRPARTLSGHSVGPVRVKSPSRPSRFRSPFVPAGLQFPDPRRVVICVRRKQRREVLFAKRLTRRGGRGPRRRNWYSAISC